MRYHSTRSLVQQLTSREAVLQGLAADGGLFVTDELPELHIDPASLTGGYAGAARRVLGTLLSDFSAEEIAGAVEAAYGNTFADPAVTPVTKIGSMHLLELYHGPTAAFKDVALQMLPQLMSRALAGTGRRLVIATATSGDTGKAALEGFADVPGIGIAVFYPDGGVSAIQRLQMATQKGVNVEVAALRGNFDDAQSAVKALFASPLKAELAARNITLTSANSINIGRLAPQVVYYFDAYRQLAEAGVIRQGERIDFCVPTGNYGDVLAGWFAKTLGLPVRRLIVASNANHVLSDFLETGVYDRRRDLVRTSSPSMDILVSSNLERALYYLDDMDPVRTAARMAALKADGIYRIEPELLDKFRAVYGCGWLDDAETSDAVREAWETTGRLIDPHTAVAWKIAQEQASPEVPMVVLSTASPFKFCRDVFNALYGPLKLKSTTPQHLNIWMRLLTPRVLNPRSASQHFARSPCASTRSMTLIRRLNACLPQPPSSDAVQIIGSGRAAWSPFAAASSLFFPSRAVSCRSPYVLRPPLRISARVLTSSAWHFRSTPFSLLSVLKRSRFPAARKLFKMKTIWCFRAFEKSSVKPGRRPFP